jgi:hypothetical protein
MRVGVHRLSGAARLARRGAGQRRTLPRARHQGARRRDPRGLPQRASAPRARTARARARPRPGDRPRLRDDRLGDTASDSPDKRPLGALLLPARSLRLREEAVRSCLGRAGRVRPAGRIAPAFSVVTVVHARPDGAPADRPLRASINRSATLASRAKASAIRPERPRPAAARNRRAAPTPRRRKLIVNTCCHPNAGRGATPDPGRLCRMRQPGPSTPSTAHEGGGMTVVAMAATSSGRRASECTRTRC